MIWKEINPTPEQVIYLLDQQQKDHFLSGIKSAQFNIARGLYHEGVIHSVDNIFPAKLSASVSIDEITFKLTVNLYDEEESRQKIGLRIETILTENGHYLGGFPPADYDKSRTALELRSIYQFQQWLERNRYVTFPSCQRILPRGKPLESDPHRPLEEQEKKLLLPYVDTLITSMEGIELKKPLREVGYYQGLVKRQLERKSI